MANLERLKALVRPVVEDHGFELVRVSLIDGPTLTLQIMLEDPATGQMKVGDCARVSRKISVLLDEADPIESEYMLEVSSPGIDRPLTRLKDFERWAGHVGKVELADAIALNGGDRKRFQGLLQGVEGDNIRMHADGLGDVMLPFADIRTAKLVLTDRLIAETAQLLSPDDADDIEEEADDLSDQTEN